MVRALTQASMITTINGNTPVTRVAACFSFGASGVTGRISDPDADMAGFELQYDDVLAAHKVYAFFLEPGFRNSAEETFPGFRCIELTGGMIYGIDAELLPALDALRTLTDQNRTAEPLLALLQERQGFYSTRRTDNTSVGTDGILLRL